jgi:hypothetical protein
LALESGKEFLNAFCIWPSTKVMFKDKNKLILRKTPSCHKQRSHSTEGVQDGKVAPAPVARGGKTVVPTFSIKIITSIWLNLL